MAARAAAAPILAFLLCALLFPRPAAPVSFEPLQVLQSGIGFTTVLALGPEDPVSSTYGDGCIYAANGELGEVHRVCFDDAKTVTSHTVPIDLNGPGQIEHLLGIAFDPASNPAGEIHLYLSYALDNLAPFNGRVARAVSTDGGVSYAVDDVFVTGLPHSNFDHQTNGLDFGPDGCLYMAQGNNSNAGFDYAFAESRLSSGILRACFKDGGGGVDPAFDRDCGDGNTQEACGVEVYASGLRNPFDLVWHASGLLYNTDNDANIGFRGFCASEANDFGCLCQDPTVEPVGDELNLIEPGFYYGSPNPYRANPSGLQCQGGTDGGDKCVDSGDCGGGGSCEDLSALCTDPSCGEPAQCFYFGDGHDPLTGQDPNGVYRPPLAQVEETLDGIAEYRPRFGARFPGSFCSDWHGHLLAAGGPGELRRFSLTPDGRTAVLQGNANLNGATGLDTATGPDGTIFVADLLLGQVTYLKPVAQPDPQLTDFFRYCDVSAEGGVWDATPAVALPVDRSAAAATRLVLDGSEYIFVLGQQGTDEVLRYDVAGDTWARSSDPGVPGPPPAPPFPMNGAPTSDHKTAAVVEGRIYTMGGLDPLTAATWVYDGMGDPIGYQRRNIGCSAGGIACSEQLNVGAAAAGVVDDAIYLAGGLCNTTGPDSQNCSCNGIVGGCGQNTDRAFRYDPKSDSWSAIAALPIEVDHAAGIGFGGRLYVIGGRRCGAHTPCEGRTEVQIYDPDADAWSFGAALPVGCSGLGAAAMNGRIYVAGGEGSACDGTVVQEYDPVADSWRLVAALPDAHHSVWPVVAGLRGDGVPEQLFVAGGGPGGTHHHRLVFSCEECEDVVDPLCAQDAECDDGDICTTDSCSAGACVHSPVGPDTDGDWICDAEDNCPRRVNPSQSDLGGIGSGSPPDGVGDACQCGDLDDDGVVTPADPLLLRQVFAHVATVGEAGGFKCGVLPWRTCSIADVTVLERTLQAPALPPGIVQNCPAAVGGL